MTEIGLGHYLTLGAIIFAIGTVGIFLNRKNIIIILMSIELILLAVNINLVSFSIYLQNIVLCPTLCPIKIFNDYIFGIRFYTKVIINYGNI